jgi:hypothetical protein
MITGGFSQLAIAFIEDRNSEKGTKICEAISAHTKSTPKDYSSRDAIPLIE